MSALSAINSAPAPLGPPVDNAAAPSAARPRLRIFDPRAILTWPRAMDRPRFLDIQRPLQTTIMHSFLGGPLEAMEPPFVLRSIRQLGWLRPIRESQTSTVMNSLESKLIFPRPGAPTLGAGPSPSGRYYGRLKFILAD